MPTTAPSETRNHPPDPRTKAKPTAGPEPGLYFPDDSGDRRRLRVAIAVATVAHLLLFALPTLHTAAEAVPENERPLVVIQQVRFKPPPPPPPEAPPPEPQAVEIPVPDPTPDELEPIRRVDEIAPITTLDYDWVAEIPTAPPAPPPPDPGPILVGGDVARPLGIHTPLPAYTELARRARVQGIVILQLTLDEQGEVKDVEVLKDLPMGLTESAVDTVSTWRYEPATLNGKPVEVLMTVTVTFTLQ